LSSLDLLLKFFVVELDKQLTFFNRVPLIGEDFTDSPSNFWG